MPVIYVPDDEDRIVYPVPLWVLLAKWTFLLLMLPFWILGGLIVLLIIGVVWAFQSFMKWKARRDMEAHRRDLS